MSLLDTIARKLKRSKTAAVQAAKKIRSGPKPEDLAKRMVLDVKKTRRFPTWTQWRHFYSSLGPVEQWLVRLASAALLLSVLFLVGRYIFQHQTSVPATGGEYTEGLIGGPQLINPLYASINDADADLASLVYSSLLTYDQDNGLVGDLAESFDVSDDGLVYTFVLREGITWHDGEPLSVRDVIGTIAMIQNPEYKSPHAVSFQGVNVIQVDDRTVQFILDEPFAPFLSTLTVGILPSHIWDLIPPKNANLADINLKPIGSGPFQFEKFTKDKLGTIKSYSLERNPDYYLSPPHLQTLTFKFYPTTNELFTALQNKQIEGVGFVPEIHEQDARTLRDLQLFQPTIPQYTALFFNEVHQPILEEADIRTALAMSVDKQAILDNALEGVGTILHTPFFHGFLGYNDSIDVTPFDPEGARQKLSESGWNVDETLGVRTNSDDEPLALTITTLNVAEFVTVAEMVKQQWEALEIQVTLNFVDLETLQASVLRERAYDVLLSAEYLGYDPDPYAFWHSSQIDYPALNVSLYANRQADELIESAREATDTETRFEAYTDFQRLLIEDMPAVFLYQNTHLYGITSRVRGIDLSTLLVPSDRFQNIEDWFVKTKRVLR